LFFSGCQPAPAPITKSAFKFNTIVTLTIYDSQDTALLDHALQLCEDYENLFSRTRENSELYQLNQGTLQVVSDETIELLNIALSYSQASGGRFDPTIGAVSSLWNFHAEKPVLPSETQIDQALEAVNYQHISLSGNQVSFQKENIQLDLGAVVKGFAADKIKAYFIEQGVKSAVINLGGNILCVGSAPDDLPFSVQIQQPFSQAPSVTIPDLQIQNRSVVTSGIYERCFELDGILYHHLLDPATGFPCENELASVTIISDHSVDGDALSTTCYLLGLEKGLDFINQRKNVQAIFITKNQELYYSDNFWAEV